MIVNCPNCQTQFNVPDEVYKPGRKARCAVCSHVFPLPELPGGAADQPGQPGPGVAAQEGAAPFAQNAAPEAAPAPDYPGADSDEDSGSEADGEDFASVLAGEGVEVDEEPAAPPRKSHTTKIIIAVLALLCLGGIGLAASFFLGVWDKVQQSAVAPGPVEMKEIKAIDVPELDKIRNMDVKTSGIKYEFIRNEKLGPILVIQGRVTNNFDKPKDYITVEARLFNSRGAVIKSQRQVCGVTLSALQLSALGQNELVKALNNRIEILANNVNVMPGQHVPYMVVFIYPPNNAVEMEVTVVDASDPPAR